MNKKTLAVGAMALAVVFTAAACSDSDTGTTAATSSATTSATTSAADDTAPHNQSDVMFARMMIPHHAQAIEMSDMLLAKEGIPEEVTALAEQIKAAQGPEIDEMNSWLEQWGEPQMPGGMPGPGHNMPGMTSMPMTSMPGMGRGMPDSDDMPGMGGMGGMGGMMSAQDMQALSDAQGTEATRLFLTHMITHHEGAIDMAEAVIRDGQYPDAVEMARTIVETQQREIETMRQLLTTL
ncbi:Uncharacterized conserved protein, DUF305 family [Rhodococcus rhodochrous J3]|jgi:uncharacterized protein (DUF305 family)|uniref:Lipoprotein n=4 Tax=Mycobacteriales TaxID=85007 RepID=A0A379PN53_9NOCA|nr:MULTISPECIES: DUF305 domain-containing protein [Mycobacteriales]MBF4479000.1 DUF305 domain-containing protein [Rhodococcus rhodochrous]MCX2966174.1 DUF305 domain-containing protein [Gordonia aquimaris]QOW01572.1 DUF305 domain-containing protein [Rhodococcus pyridinivorans]QOW01718.1 DUF305 domain-containing protein [Rhodococcus pyridinivorans]SMG58257.1 Uncharacterized conserved protein, DUF305 family [Rhodococcus rhodochrous J3]